VAHQRFAAPVLRDEGKQTKLDFVPFAGSGREVADRDLQPGFVGQFLQLQFPQPPSRSVAASTVRCMPPTAAAARARNQQMHMILRHLPFHDRYLMLPADMPDQIPHARRDLALQCWPSILRYPHQMPVDFKYSVRAPRRYSAIPEVYPARALKAIA